MLCEHLLCSGKGWFDDVGGHVQKQTGGNSTAAMARSGMTSTEFLESK